VLAARLRRASPNCARRRLARPDCGSSPQACLPRPLAPFLLAHVGCRCSHATLLAATRTALRTRAALWTRAALLPADTSRSATGHRHRHRHHRHRLIMMLALHASPARASPDHRHRHRHRTRAVIGHAPSSDAHRHRTRAVIRRMGPPPSPPAPTRRRARSPPPLAAIASAKPAAEPHRSRSPSSSRRARRLDAALDRHVAQRSARLDAQRSAASTQRPAASTQHPTKSGGSLGESLVPRMVLRPYAPRSFASRSRTSVVAAHTLYRSQLGVGWRAPTAAARRRRATTARSLLARARRLSLLTRYTARSYKRRSADTRHFAPGRHAPLSPRSSSSTSTSSSSPDHDARASRLAGSRP
jgi:hypothetical protein